MNHHVCLKWTLKRKEEEDAMFKDTKRVLLTGVLSLLFGGLLMSGCKTTQVKAAGE